MPRLCLYQPDIAAIMGSILRLGACLGTDCEIIGPCGFPFDDARLRRSAMDYIEHVTYRYHTGWDAFNDWRTGENAGRLVLLTTKGATPLHDFRFQADDLLLFGREGAGVPQVVHDSADARVIIPMRADVRSLNLAQSAAITLAEALRQTAQWPQITHTETAITAAQD